MKRIFKTLLFILLIYFIFPVLVNAATSLDTKNQRPVVGTNIEVTLRVDYGNDVKISEAHYYVTYDPTLLELENVSWTQSKGSYSNANGVVTIDKFTDGEAWGYGTPVVLKFKSIKAGASNIDITEKSPGKYNDGSILAQSYSGITINAVNPSSATRIGKLYVEGFSVSPTFNVDNYKYTLIVPSTTTKVNVVATKGEKNQTITGDGQRVLLYGDNRVRVTVTAQNGDSSTYEIMIHRTDDRSGDVSLKSLNIGDKSIEIEENKTTYETIVSRSVESIFLSAQTTDSKATLVGTGQKQLNIGENIFELRVSSKNNTEVTYKIIITRSTEELQENVESTLLSSLTVNNTNIPIEENKYNYIYSIENDINKLNIAPVTKSTSAKYKIEGNKDLKTGFNKITITINDAELTPQTYTLIVYKQPKKTTKYDTLKELKDEEELKNDIYYVTTESDKISKDILDLLNKNKLKLYYNIENENKGLLYQIVIPYGEYTTDINPTITRSATSPLTLTTELPAGIPVMIYVGDIYADNTDLKVYTYNEIGTYTDLTTSVRVVDGYVNITTNGEKNYVFSGQNMIAGGFNILNYIPHIIFGAVILFLLIYIIKKKNKNKEVINSKEPLY